ncbi:hypothetical protein T07_11219 [Trichinella nelsoni]|uniref:Uncharacterized protein n=1 Tax=Trichinella nelsoni TaxID=6336 RepID=A0A0V0RVL1_9BILA|nr:hypothetical protein T07_11219 [Trichinella nelsoni]
MIWKIGDWVGQMPQEVFLCSSVEAARGETSSLRYISQSSSKGACIVECELFVLDSRCFFWKITWLPGVL